MTDEEAAQAIDRLYAQSIVDALWQKPRER